MTDTNEYEKLKARLNISYSNLAGFLNQSTFSDLQDADFKIRLADYRRKTITANKNFEEFLRRQIEHVSV